MNDGIIPEEHLFPVAQQILGDEEIIDLQKTSGGISSNIVKITTADNVYYLRVSRYDDESYAPEVIVHKKLLKLGIKVPEVIFFD